MNEFQLAASLISSSKNTVAFTGAGISTESGIPDFRSPGGIWDRYDPEEFAFQKFLSSEESRRKYWRMSSEFFRTLKDIMPNKAHYSLAELEKKGKLQWIITQNVDHLHQKAGSFPDRVIELHGTVSSVSCLSCGKKYLSEEVYARVEKGVEVPYCDECRGILKPDTISFGQPMPEDKVRLALDCSRKCDLFMVIGSSLVVYPAAQMPMEAKGAGAKLIIVNLSETPQDSFCDLIIREKAGAALPKILEYIYSTFP